MKYKFKDEDSILNCVGKYLLYNLALWNRYAPIDQWNYSILKSYVYHGDFVFKRSVVFSSVVKALVC